MQSNRPSRGKARAIAITRSDDIRARLGLIASALLLASLAVIALSV